MKKNILASIIFISCNLIYSQVLFFEDFENYNSFQDLIDLHDINYVNGNSNWDSDYLFNISGSIDIDINENYTIDTIEDNIKNTQILSDDGNKIIKFELNKVNSLFYAIHKFDSDIIDNKIPLSEFIMDKDGRYAPYERRHHGIEISEELGAHGVMSGINEVLTPLKTTDKYYRNIMNRNEVNTHTGQKRGFLPQQEYWFNWKIKLDGAYQLDQIDEINGFLNGDTVYNNSLNANVNYASHIIDANNNTNKYHNSEVLGQWHINSDADPYSDPIHINIINGSWWIDFTFRIKLSGSSDGYIEIWKNRRIDDNGQVTSDYHTTIDGANHINNSSPVYFKYGIYKADWWSHNDKVGTSTTKKVV